MAEKTSSSALTKNIRKHTGRAKEKLLVSLGKADRTTDEDFQLHSNNFHKQQKSAERLQKELKNYVTCLKALSEASKGFYEAFRESYEPEWPGSDHVRALSQSIELMYEDQHEKLLEQALGPLNTYATQFTDVKAKIAKRGRKLVDFDSARHNVTAAQDKKKDELKVQKATAELHAAKTAYEEINNELLRELPALFDSRINFYVHNFQTLFNLEKMFHSDTGKLYTDLSKELDVLGRESANFKIASHFAVPRRTSEVPALPVPNGNESASDKRLSVEPATVDRSSPATSTADESKGEMQPNALAANDESVRLYPRLSAEPTVGSGTEDGLQADSSNPFDDEGEDGISAQKAKSPPKVEENKIETLLADASKPVVSSKQQPLDQSKVLFTVRATHAYTKEDSDELSFEPGELIHVVAFEDPDEQDDGWLMGYKVGSAEKGVFPENFTKRVD